MIMMVPLALKSMSLNGELSRMGVEIGCVSVLLLFIVLDGALIPGWGF